MQRQGNPQFIHLSKSGTARAVAFSPKDRYLFCSGCDGHVYLCTAQKLGVLRRIPISSVSMTRNVNAVRFTHDGSKILASTSSRKLAVVDVEKGQQIVSYDNCTYCVKERTGLATDTMCPNLVACSHVNGKGLTLLDLRMPLPLHYIYDIHNSVITDIAILDCSWPCVDGLPSAIITISHDGVCKILSWDGRTLYSFSTDHTAYSVTPTPELFGSTADDGFYSFIMVGGKGMSAYVPDFGIQEHYDKKLDHPIWKVRYSSNGSMLYSVSGDGVVSKYRRYPDYHHYIGQLYQHRGGIQDMDISPYDEYIVTASVDKSIGVMCLGSPNHGWTGYSELT